MADSTKVVGIVIKGDDQLTPVLTKTNAALKATTQAFAAVGATAKVSGDEVKKVAEGAASAWSPAISAAQRYARETKTAMESAKAEMRSAQAAVKAAGDSEKQSAQDVLQAKKTAYSQAAEAAKSASQAAALEQKTLSRQMIADARAQADVQKQLARDVARENAEGQRQAAKEVATAQKQATREAEAARTRPRGNDLLAQSVTAQGIQEFGGFINGAGRTGVGFVDNSTDLFKQQETTLKTIEAVTGSASRANEIFKEMDARSTTSVFNLSELDSGAKTLEGARLTTEKFISTIDDLAAANKELNATPQDVAVALRRITSGDTGEGIERLGDFGISKLDLKDKGIQFDGGGAVSDKSREGLDKLLEAVQQITKERFGGLSNKLATETFEGVESNKQDAKERVLRQVGEGAAWTKTQVDDVGMSLLKVIGYAPGLNKVAGAFTFIGSEAASGIGSIIGVAGQLGQAFIGLQAWREARKRNAVAAVEEAEAVTASGAASATAGARSGGGCCWV